MYFSRVWFMKNDAITINVTPEIAEAYCAASDEDRRKMGLLANLQLAEFLKSPELLEDIMDEMSREARERGMTSTILDSILND